MVGGEPPCKIAVDFWRRLAAQAAQLSATERICLWGPWHVSLRAASSPQHARQRRLQRNPVLSGRRRP